MQYGPSFPPVFRAMFHARSLRQFASEHRCENTGSPGVIPCACHMLARAAWWEAPKRSAKAELTAQGRRLAGQPAFEQVATPMEVPLAEPEQMRRVA